MNYEVVVSSAGEVTVQAGDKRFQLQELDGLGRLLVSSTLKDALAKVEDEPKPKAKTKGKTKTRANGKKYRHLETGLVYANKTELGRVLSPDAKYPHKSVDAAVKQGLVEVVQ